MCHRSPHCQLKIKTSKPERRRKPVGGKPAEPAGVLSAKSLSQLRFPPVRRRDLISYLLARSSTLIEVYLQKDPEQFPVLCTPPFYDCKTEPQVSTSLSVCHRPPGSCHVHYVTTVGRGCGGENLLPGLPCGGYNMCSCPCISNGQHCCRVWTFRSS